MIATGSRLGPYEITGMIGAGGMGVVYRARDTRLGRIVAIKVLPAALSSNERLRERLSREARAISSVTDPHICTLFDIGHQDGVDYLVMEHLEGQTLADALARGPLPLDQLLRYGIEIAGAMAAAHRHGVVHRDLKPGNIMLTKAGAKVLDFGLATHSEEAPAANQETVPQTLTEEGTVVGTLQYMAPEQLQGHPADARSDIFALGAILHEMANGRRPFEAPSRNEIIAAILHAEPAPLKEPALDQLVRRCLAKDPDDRLQSARDLQFALQQMSQPYRTMAGKGRRSPLFLIGAVVVLLAVAGLTALLMTRRRTTAAGTTAPKTIAVLPFANLGADRSRDYLLLAIPDEITTILTYSPDLAVRPFSASRRMSGDIDPQEAAKKLDAAGIISGHLMDAGGRLTVTLEAIDVANDKLLWRDMFDVPSADLITMRSELGTRIRSGLLPRLAGGSELREGGGPRNAEAYGLYLRAAAMSPDVQPNKEALRLLESAVRLDPTYAPAWAALSRRAGYEGAYSDGGRAARERSKEAANRALELDPDLIQASLQLITSQAERGETLDALRDAKRLVERRPGSSDAHFALSYVLRYGGAIEESAKECDLAWSIDPRNRGLRACALSFEQLHNYNRARDFTGIDPGTEWSKRINGRMLISEGKLDEALQTMPNHPIRQLVSRWRSGAQPSEIDQLVEALVRRDRDDGESFYSIAAYVSMVERPESALAILINESLRRNYCSVPAIDTDMMFESVRRLPEFAAYRQKAGQCRERFMAAVRAP